MNDELVLEELVSYHCPYCGDFIPAEQQLKVGRRVITCGSTNCQKEHEATRNRNKNEERRNSSGIYVSPRANRNHITKQPNKRKKYTKENPPPEELQCKREDCWNKKESATLILCASCEIELLCGDDHPLREVYAELTARPYEVDKFDNKTAKAGR